jgi:anaerobic selenocysteine-containing dehydrogenase/biotin carboxylase
MTVDQPQEYDPNLIARTLLVLGAKGPSKPGLFQAAQIRGIRVVLVKESATWEKEYCDAVLSLEIDNYVNLEETVAAVVAFAREQQVEGVITTFDSAVPVMAHVAQTLGLHGPSPEAAAALRDKHAMRKRFAELGLPSAASILVHTLDEAIRAAAEIGYPVVVKPTVGTGSAGVVLAHSESEIENAFRIARAVGLDFNGTEDLVVEEYLDGLEVTVDALVFDGEVLFHNISDNPDLMSGPYFSEVEFITPTAFPAEIEQAAYQANEQTINGFGLNFAVVHSEMRMTSRGPRLLELHPRPAGQRVPQIIKRSLGIDLFGAAIEIALGHRPTITPVRGGYAGYRCLCPEQPGVLRAINGVDAARNSPGVFDIELTVQPGTRMATVPEVVQQDAGYVYATADTYEEVHRRLLDATGLIELDLQAQELQTHRPHRRTLVDTRYPPRTGVHPVTADRIVPGACPLDCPDGCSWQVTVRDTQAVKLRGTPGHPFTRGTLCVKVNQYLDHTRADERLLHPMRRTGPKGSGQFERISWDDALGEIASRLTGVIRTYGGEAIWPYQGTGSLGWIQGLEGRAGSRLWNVLGASRHHMTICSIAGLEGLIYTMGVSRGMDPEDLRHSRLILLWGTNTLTSGHHLWRPIQEAQRNGAHVVSIDPVRTRTAEQADEHIAIRPGTDAALALGLLNVVISHSAEDTEYLAAHTLGWERFRKRIEGFTLERVARETGIVPDRVVELGQRLASTRPTAIRVSQGLQRHAGGGMALRTLACIPGVTGDWQYPGGGLHYSTDGYFRPNTAAAFRDDLLARPVRQLSMTRIAESLLERQDPPVKALIIYGANPAASSPDQTRIRQGLAREDLFTVVLEHFQTDTADYADIVLPATMQPEHMDLHNGYGHLYVAWNEPAVAPPGECLSTTETFRRLASAMGLTERCLYDSDEDIARQLLDSDDPALAGITFDELRMKGWARLQYPSPHLPFREGFPTPSGKLEFVSETAAADGHDPVAGYIPAQEADDPELKASYPLVLLSTASHFAVNTIFGNKPELRRRAGVPQVTLHPEDATVRGLESGDPIRIWNARGSFEAVAVVDDCVAPGVALTPKGHWAKLSPGRRSVNSTVAERDADLGGGAVFHDNRVQIAESTARDESARSFPVRSSKG